MSAPAVAKVELVEAMMDLIERDEQHALTELVDEHAHPEIEWMPLIAAGVEGVYHGRDGVRRFVEDLNDLIRRGRVYSDQAEALSAADALASEEMRDA
jgi:hypothetical protein